ncbi:ATP-binding protein [Azospirillum sp. SYSU D00513]|uniref:ATP-binding protein n=1 Tax=Azospirillum sp. SYSU D00513 TaxID=2812561 RepID=UPI001FFFF68A|nr:ATP-binding protein [Azospirillum sp. SYSU D00513]
MTPLSEAGESASPERVLILASRGRDATIAASILREAGLAAEACADLGGLLRELELGAGLAVLADEDVRTADLHALAGWVGRQPPWSDFPFIVLTSRGGGLERNPALARLQDLLGNAGFLERPFHPATFVSAALTALRGRRRQYEARARLKELHDLNATLERRVAEEVAEKLGAEEKLRQSQKMEAVGQLTGGVAHDFNNLLQAISGSLELIERRVLSGSSPGAAELEPYTRAARQSVDRAAALTQRLLAFSRRQPLQPKAVDLNAVVAGMEDLIRRSVGLPVTVEIIAETGLWASWVDANQLENTLLNLAINARDAMPDGGRITIRTANADLRETAAAAEAGVEPGRYALLSVTDTGMGMTPDVLEQAFEPFFTTKPVGQGTGLGLSQLHGFVHQSGGHIRIATAVGEGTTVTLYLPLHSGPVAGPAEMDGAAGDGPDAPPAGMPVARTILVVEDEALVRMVIADTLQERGYDVLEAEDGPSALSILESAAPIDLLTTDVGLPGMNGRQVAEMARRLRPGLKVLFLTGYAHGAGMDDEALGAGTQLLSKPVALDSLTAKVASMLAASNPALERMPGE